MHFSLYNHFSHATTKTNAYIILTGARAHSKALRRLPGTPFSCPPRPPTCFPAFVQALHAASGAPSPPPLPPPLPPPSYRPLSLDAVDSDRLLRLPLRQPLPCCACQASPALPRPLYALVSTTATLTPTPSSSACRLLPPQPTAEATRRFSLHLCLPLSCSVHIKSRRIKSFTNQRTAWRS